MPGYNRVRVRVRVRVGVRVRIRVRVRVSPPHLLLTRVCLERLRLPREGWG